MVSLSALQTATAKTMAVVTLVAILAFLLARTVGAAAGDNASPNNQGNQQVLDQLATVQQQISDFQDAMDARLDLIDAALSALDAQISQHDTGMTTSIGNHNSGISSIISDHDSGIATSLSLHDASSQNQVNAETAEIDLALSDLHTLTDGHVNPDPFAITVNTCSSFGGAAHLLGALGATAKTGLNGEAGGNVFGNGGTVDVEVEGTAGLLFDIGAALDMTHQVCNAGVYRPYSKAHTPGQEAAIDDYTAVAVALQNPGKLVSLATEGMGLDIAVIPDALQALADAGSTPADPTALFSGAGTSTNLMDSLDIGGGIDTDALLETFTDPCGTIAGLGSGDATDICGAIDSTFGDAILAINQTVDDIDAAINGTIEPIVSGIHSTVAAIDSAIDDVIEAIDSLDLTGGLTGGGDSGGGGGGGGGGGCKIGDPEWWAGNC